MKLNKIFAAAAVALAAIGSAQAAPTITNLDGNLNPFGGFDWASGGSAFTTGFTGVVGSTFTMTYAAWATSISNTSGNTLAGANRLDNTADGISNSIGQNLLGGQSYEYTIYATIQEKVVACTASTCTFQVLNGGTFDIYYDTAANAKTVANGAWTGFKNGVKVVSGSVDVSGNQTFDQATGGQVALTGMVSMTDATYINPALVRSNFTSTLQLSGAVTSFATPTSIDGAAVNAGQIVFQADGNQTFSTAVPEPAGLALVGLALAGCGLVSRRRKSA